jgi:hypothetical protein
MDATTNATMGKLSTLLLLGITPMRSLGLRRIAMIISRGVNYARNPFIDHPDWANYIWDANGMSGLRLILRS